MFVAFMPVAPGVSMCKICVFYIRLVDEYLSLGIF